MEARWNAARRKQGPVRAAGADERSTPLAPDIVEAILDGRQPEGLGLPGLMERLPVEWDKQRMALASWALSRSLPNGGPEGTVGRKGLI